MEFQARILMLFNRSLVMDGASSEITLRKSHFPAEFLGEIFILSIFFERKTSRLHRASEGCLGSLKPRLQASGRSQEAPGRSQEAIQNAPGHPRGPSFSREKPWEKPREKPGEKPRETLRETPREKPREILL